MRTHRLNTKQEEIVLGGEILREMRERIVKNFLDVIVLIKLREGSEPIGGYDVVKFVHKKFGVLLSAGSAYALLYSMERDGLIKCGLRRKRLYILTDKGKERIKMISQVKERFLGLVVDIFR